MENTPDYNQSGEYNIPPEQPTYTTTQQDPNKAVMTMGEWFITYLILMIPLVNIIMLFVWAFGDGNENRKNFSRVQLIFMLISIVLLVLFGTIIVGVVYSIFNNMSTPSTLISIGRLFI